LWIRIFSYMEIKIYIFIFCAIKCSPNHLVQTIPTTQTPAKKNNHSTKFTLPMVELFQVTRNTDVKIMTDNDGHW